MIIKQLSVEGLRGFSKKVDLNFAIPNKKDRGSGLTILVGPNNSGKSTIIEAVHILNSGNNSLPKSARNILNDKKVKIVAVNEKGEQISVQTTENGGSYLERKYNNRIVEGYENILNAFVLTNKRNFTSSFGNSGGQPREIYKSNTGGNSYRSENNINQNFGGRLIKIFNNGKNKFNECLEKVLSPIPKWTIESLNENQMYLEFSFGKIDHNSQGAGDGFINIFNIVDSLYDSTEDNLILIDEPEVSLHPDLQKKLLNLLLEYSKDKQIIISTHSPYFIDWEALSSFSKIIRLRKENEVISCYELSDETKTNIIKLLKDTNNLHILSLNTNEIFFLGDNIILTEGQEDVYGYKKIFKYKNFNPNASFFGWGSGGAEKFKIILKMLEDLGYKKVFTILDNNKKDNIKDLEDKFPQYRHYAILADDIRNKDRDRKVNNLINEIKNMDIEEITKEEIVTLVEKIFPKEEGLLTKLYECKINPKYENSIDDLIKNIECYFNDK